MLISSCVPKATEKKANCGTDQSFNSVTRECISTQKSRSLPVATTSALTFTENQIQDFQLKYTDKDADLAVSCKVIDADTKIETFSPKMNEAFVEGKKLIDYFALANTVHNAQASGGTHIATINAYLLDMQNDISTIEQSFSINDVLPAYEDLILKANDSYNLMKAYTSTSSLVYFNNLVRDQILVAKPFMEAAVNRCFCDGAGICKTRGGVIGSSSGTSSLSYYITDALDGASITKQITISITNVNKAPFAASTFFAHTESANSTPTSTGFFPHPSGYDADGNALTFIKVTNPSNGSVICNSSECNYTPNNGDLFSDTADYAHGEVTFYGVKFTAKFEGAWSNSIIFKFLDSNLSDERYFYSGPFVKVEYPNVFIYVPNDYQLTPATFSGILNADPVLSLYGIFSDVSGTPVNVTSLPQPYQVTNGAGGFDSFTYKYRDSNGVDSNIATIVVGVAPTNDPPEPITPLVASPAVEIDRNISYSDNSTVLAGPFKESVALYYSGTNFYTDADDATPDTATHCKVSLEPFAKGGAIGTVEDGYSNPATRNLYSIVVGNCSCSAGQCSFDVSSKYREDLGTFIVYYGFYDGDWSNSYQSIQVKVVPKNTVPKSNIAPSFNTAAAVLNTTLAEDYSQDNSSSWTSLITVPVWANDGVTPDNEVDSGSFQQNISYSMSLTGGTNLYEATNLSANIRLKYLTCTTNCTTACTETTVSSVSSGLTDFINLGIGSISTSGANNLRCLKVEYFTKAEQSGSFDLALKLKDDSRTTGEDDQESSTYTNTITVTNVNDRPKIIGFEDTSLALNSEKSLTSIETAENSQALSVAFQIDEGGDDGENSDEVLISQNSLTSDNTTLLPTSSIQIIFDRDGDGLYESTSLTPTPDLSSVAGNEVFAATEVASNDLQLEHTSDAPTKDAKGDSSQRVGRRLLFKITPTAGNYGVANIRFRLKDSPGALSFHEYVLPVVVHPVTSIHGGWTHLASQGIKVTKSGSSLTSTYDCANGANLSGTGGSPNGVRTSSAADAMDTYYDTSFDACYYSSVKNTSNKWFSLDTYCPMSNKCKSDSTSDSDSDLDKTCLYETTDPDLATIGSVLGENDVYGVVDTTTHVVSCKRIKNGIGVDYTPSSVTLAWRSFSAISSSAFTPDITGYKVFRRQFNEEYDLKEPIATIGENQLSYTDETAFGGMAYYYKVVPIVSYNSKVLTAFSNESFSEVRMVAPPANYSFVHRWMANQEVCNKMGFTVDQVAPNRVDPTHNYRCPYRGPGATLDGTDSYYDIGSDFLVDTFESGCPFTEGPVCDIDQDNDGDADGAKASCISMYNPPTVTIPVAGTVFYNRSTGVCKVSSGATWVDFNLSHGAGLASTSLMSKTVSHFNPPLTNVDRDQAILLCQDRGTVSITTSASTATGTFQLPSRKEQIAFMAAPMEMQSSNKSYNELPDATIETIENGQSLNNYGFCNANNSNGVSSSFIDAHNPPSSLLFTVPGTASSSIRSLATGSIQWGSSFYGTTQCVSRYGMQDVYGNVSEWVRDTLSWSGTNYITSGASFNFDLDNDVLYTPEQAYHFNSAIGPCNDSVASDGCNSADLTPTDPWDIIDRSYGASYIALPVGLPFTDDFYSNYSAKLIVDSLLRIGQSSGGITSAALHGDSFIINDGRPAQVSGSQVYMSTGGNYTSSNSAGRYSFELHPSASPSSAKIGFRCRAVVNY